MPQAACSPWARACLPPARYSPCRPCACKSGPDVSPLHARLGPLRRVGGVAQLGRHWQSRVLPSRDDHLARRVALAAKAADHVGQIGESRLFEHLARALRTSARHTSDDEVPAAENYLLGNLDKVEIHLHLPRTP